MDNDAIICVRCASLSRPDSEFQVVEDISFDVFKTDMIALMGPNGCGKTTIVKLILGRLKLTSGEITAKPMRIGYVDQDLVLFPWMSVRKNICFSLNRRGIAKGRQATMVSDLVLKFNIGDLLHKYPLHLSGGMRQKAVIARALVDSPEFLLLDEPFSALDNSSKHEVHKLIISMNIPFILVTHDPAEVVRLCNKVILFGGGHGKPGKVVAEFDIDKTDPASRKRIEDVLECLLAERFGESSM